MRIGTMRVEEARVFDSEAGFHQFHNDEGEPYGSFEVYWHDLSAQDERDEDDDADYDHAPAGWYWRAGFPGCMPDGEPEGPFATSYKARADADEFWEG